MRAVGMVLGLMVFAAAAQAQTTEKPTNCRADRRGEDLITRIEYSNGYAVEGPWHVTALGVDRGARTITAVLDHIVEVQAFTLKREMTPLPGAIEMTFRGQSSADVLNEAAHVWCTTILQAHPPTQMKPPANEVLSQNRITE